MKTPLWDKYLSNENFKKIKDFENMNLSIKRVDDHIEVKFKLTYSPNMYIYEQDGLYYMCVNIEINRFQRRKKDDKKGIN